MTFWIQHGYGKANKIESLADTGLLTGVVLSPADEDYQTLELTVDTIHGRDAQVLLDPQLYIHTIPEAVARCHKSNGIDFGELSCFVSPGEIDKQVKAVVTVNRRLNISPIVAPSPYQASFGDVWTPLSLQYARATIDIADRPVYISLVAEDTAFSDWDKTSQFLDALTTIDAAGVYLLVGTSTKSYPFAWEPDRLANVLRVIYTLAQFNRYDVIWGYSDLAGVLGLAAGATGAATGWYHSLRMWTEGKWIPRGGGRQANPRVFVEPLLSTIERDSEAVSIARTEFGAQTFPNPDELQSIRDQSPWGIADSWEQHLKAMAQVHQSVDSNESLRERITGFRNRLFDARELLANVIAAGAAVAPLYSNQLTSLMNALDIFSARESL